MEEVKVHIKPAVASLEEVRATHSFLSNELRLFFEEEITARRCYRQLYTCEPEEDLGEILEGELSGAIQVQKEYFIEAGYALPLSRVLSSLEPEDIFRVGGMELLKWYFLHLDTSPEGLLAFMETRGFKRKDLIDSKKEIKKFEDSTCLFDSIYAVVSRHSEFTPIIGTPRFECLSCLKPKANPEEFDIWPLSTYTDSLTRLNYMSDESTPSDRYTPLTMDAPFGLVLCWKGTPQALLSFIVSKPRQLHIEQLQGLQTVRFSTDNASSRGLARFSDPFAAMLKLIIFHAKEMGIDSVSVIKNPPVSIRRDEYGKPLFSDEMFRKRYEELPKRLGFEDEGDGLIYKLK